MAGGLEMTDDRTWQCAATLMETFHLMMRTVGPEMRRRSSPPLSFAQFRVVKALEHHRGASLSQVAEHLGATLSAASKVVDGLVERGYVQRETAEDDRRKLTLSLTPSGEQVLESLHQEAVSCLAERLTTLSSNECEMLSLAMDMLRSSLTAGQSASGRHPTESNE